MKANKGKSYMSLIICMIYMLIASTVSFATDYEGHWAEEAIVSALESSYIAGYPDGTFKPNENVSRAEFFSMVNQYYGFTNITEVSFKDVAKGDWYEETISKALAANYVAGYSDGSIRPNAPITREEAAIVLSKASKLATSDVASLTFTDSKQIASWSKPFVNAVINRGYLKGYEDATFRPQNNITRAEAVSALETIKQLNQNRYKAAGIYGSDNETVISNSVTIESDGITLNHYKIMGDLIITEVLGDGNLVLNQVTVLGDTIIRGGGANSIHMNGGSYQEIIVEKIASDAVRIVSDDTKKLNLHISERAQNQRIILDGYFGDVSLEGKNVIVETMANTNIKNMTIDQRAVGSKLVLPINSRIETLMVNAKTDITGRGYIQSATVTAKDVSFETKPNRLYDTANANRQASSNHAITHTDTTVKATDISITDEWGDLEVFCGGTLQMEASISPSNATDKSIVWEVTDGTEHATISESGLLSGITVGTATVKARNNTSGIETTKVVSVVSSANVHQAKQFEDAVKATGVSQVTLTENLVGNIDITRMGDNAIAIDFGAYTLTGNLNLVANDVTSIHFSGDSGYRLLGNLSIAAPKASVTNEIGLSGSATLNGVAYSSYDASGEHGGGINMLGQGRINLSGAGSSASINLQTEKPVVLAGTITGGVNLNVPNVRLLAEGNIGSVNVLPGSTGAFIQMAVGSSISSVGASENLTLGSEGGALPSAITGSGTVVNTVVYRVTFDRNGGNKEAEPQYVLVQEGMTLGDLPNQPLRSNYTFKEWNTATGTIINDETVVNSPFTAYAQWQAIPVSNITVTSKGNLSKIETQLGSLQMSATVLPSDALNTTVKWSVSDTSIAKIDANGLLTAIKNGTVIVTATAKDGSNVVGSKQITISNQLGAEISGLDGVIQLGESVSTVASTTEPGAGKWSSSQPAIASIDAVTGEILAVSEGTTTISYMSSTSGRLNSKTLTVYPEAQVEAPVIGNLVVGDSGTLAELNITLSNSETIEWQSSDDTKATVNAQSGLVTPISSGNVTIKYKITNKTTGVVVAKGEIDKEVQVAVTTVTPDAFNSDAWFISDNTDGTALIGINVFDSSHTAIETLTPTNFNILLSGTQIQFGSITKANYTHGGTYFVTLNHSSGTYAVDVTAKGVLIQSNMTVNISNKAIDPSSDAVINSTSIGGVTVPVRGETPVTQITETAQYTGTIAWSPAHGTFDASQVYTATITLTPKTGYTLTGVTANMFTVLGATSVNNDADSGVITAVFPATDADPVVPPVGSLLDSASTANLSGVLYTNNGNLYYNSIDNAGNWQGEFLVGVGAKGRLCFDDTGKVHIAYETLGNIGYRNYDGVVWSDEALTASIYAGVCTLPDIAVDANGFAHITYTDSKGTNSDDYNYPDIMYMDNKSGEFVKKVIFNGNGIAYGGSDYDYEYYNGGSNIALDATGQYIIMAHQYKYSKWFNGSDKQYAVRVISEDDASGVTTSTSTNKAAVYDLAAFGDHIVALYKQNTFKVSDLTTVGAVISYSNTSELTGTAINAVMTDGTNTYVGGYATTLETHYNGAVHHYDGIVVQSGTRVGLGKQGDVNYVFYTDNADATIKRLPFYMPVSVTNISVGTDNSEQTVKVGDTIQMTASALPVNASDTTVTWSVDSGTGTATSDVNGLLTGETVGTVTVNATANDGSGIMGSKSITVTAADIAVQVINVSSAGNVVNMTTGETLQCSAEVLPVDATDRTVT